MIGVGGILPRSRRTGRFSAQSGSIEKSGFVISCRRVNLAPEVIISSKFVRLSKKDRYPSLCPGAPLAGAYLLDKGRQTGACPGAESQRQDGSRETTSGKFQPTDIGDDASGNTVSKRRRRSNSAQSDRLLASAGTAAGLAGGRGPANTYIRAHRKLLVCEAWNYSAVGAGREDEGKLIDV